MITFLLRFRSHPQVPCSREVLSILVKGHCHHSVSGVEGFLHTISMVNINVDIQDPLVIPRIRKESKCCISSERAQSKWEVGKKPCTDSQAAQ